MKKLLLPLLILCCNSYSTYPPKGSILSSLSKVGRLLSIEEKPFDGLQIIPKISNDGLSIFTATNIGNQEPYWFATQWGFEGKDALNACPHMLTNARAISISDDEKTIQVITSQHEDAGGFLYCHIFKVVDKKWVWLYRKTVAPDYFILGGGAVNHDGSLFAVSFSSMSATIIEVYETHTGKKINLFIDSDDPPNYIQLKWYGDDLVSYSQIKDPSIDFWDPKTGQRKRRLIFKNQLVLDVDYAISNGYIAVGELDYSQENPFRVKILDAQSNITFDEPVSTFCYWVGFSPDAKRIAAVTGDRILTVWDAESHAKILESTLDRTRKWDNAHYDFRWIDGKTIKWAFCNGVTGSIGT